MDIGLATLITAGIAAFLSSISLYYSYESTRKTTFINIVTSERIKWMANLRDTISLLCSITYRWSVWKPEESESREDMKEIDKLMVLIKLMLNPYDKEDEQKKIIELLDSIPDYARTENKIQLRTTLQKIVATTQILLKKEWDRVKKEAKEGEIEQEPIYPWMKFPQEREDTNKASEEPS